MTTKNTEVKPTSIPERRKYLECLIANSQKELEKLDAEEKFEKIREGLSLLVEELENNTYSHNCKVTWLRIFGDESGRLGEGYDQETPAVYDTFHDIDGLIEILKDLCQKRKK